MDYSDHVTILLLRNIQIQIQIKYSQASISKGCTGVESTNCQSNVIRGEKGVCNEHGQRDFFFLVIIP